MGLADRLYGEHLRSQNLLAVLSELKTVIHDLVQVCPEVKILLFGSFAKGQGTQGSDLDLAVVVPDTFDKKIFKKTFFENRSALKIPIDFIFRTQSEFQSSSDENPVDIEILITGIEVFPNWMIDDKL